MGFHLLVILNRGQSLDPLQESVISSKTRRTNNLRSSAMVTLTETVNNEWILAIHLDYLDPETREIAPRVYTVNSLEPLQAVVATQQWMNCLNCDKALFPRLFDNCFKLIRKATRTTEQPDYPNYVKKWLSDKQQQIIDHRFAIAMQASEHSQNDQPLIEYYQEKNDIDEAMN